MSTDRVRKRKVLCVLPSMNGGGAEKVMLLLLSGLDRKRHQLTLVLFEKKGALLHDVPQDIQIHCLNKRGKLDAIYLPGRLAGYIEKVQPDVVLSFLWYANIMNVLASRFWRHNVPIIISVHNFLSVSLTIQRYSKIKRLFTSLFFPMADEVIAVSQAAKRDLICNFKVPKSKISVITNGIDKEQVAKHSAEQPESNIFDDTVPVIIAVGRLSKQKGFDLLIRTFAKVREKHKVKLLILGEGEERAELEHLSAELGLSDYVSMPGFVSNPYTYIKRSFLYVMSSNFEGFPVVLLEVMACGTPIISTNCTSGPDEILEDRITGILVQVGDIEALNNAICNLLNDPEYAKQLAEIAKHRVNDWTIESMVNNHERLLAKYCI
ncbi:Glycosyl transferase, group 1 [hydrothermal vent metagenome]|uniref:Glycosyl transferase, group 1 n=1 Tax=hydrothermal vent metagenome TaxID=652676 RepID=A0A3B1C3X0_9ZZZZ